MGRWDGGRRERASLICRGVVISTQSRPRRKADSAATIRRSVSESEADAQSAAAVPLSESESEAHITVCIISASTLTT